MSRTRWSAASITLTPLLMQIHGQTTSLLVFLASQLTRRVRGNCPRSAPAGLGNKKDPVRKANCTLRRRRGHPNHAPDSKPAQERCCQRRKALWTAASNRYLARTTSKYWEVNLSLKGNVRGRYTVTYGNTKARIRQLHLKRHQTSTKQIARQVTKTRLRGVKYRSIIKRNDVS